MARPRILDATQLERAKNALNSGCNFADVAERFGVSKQTLVRSGLRVRHFKSSKKKKKTTERFVFSLWGNRDPDKRTPPVVLE